MPYLLGIIAGKWVSLPVLWLWLTVLLCLVGGITTRHRKRYLCYGLLHLAIFAGGMLRLTNRLTSTDSLAFLQPTGEFHRHHHISTRTRGKRVDACYATGELQLLSDPTQAVSAKFLIRFQNLVPAALRQTGKPHRGAAATARRTESGRV